MGEDALLVHDETRADPPLAFALVAPVVARRPCPPRWACSGRSPRPTYEAEVQRQLVAAVGASGSRRPRRSSATGASPGKSPDRRRATASPSLRSRLRNTMPVRGLGAKNVVFSGMRRSARGRGADRLDRDRAQEHRGVGVALRRPARRRSARRCGTRGSRRAPRGARRRRSAPSRRRAARAGSRPCGASSSAVGTSSARPSRSTRPRLPPSRIATSSAATPSGVLGPAACTKNGPPSASRSSRRRRREQPVDGAHAELVGRRAPRPAS